VMEIPVRMRQTRMHPVSWESPPGFKCQTRSTRYAYWALGSIRQAGLLGSTLNYEQKTLFAVSLTPPRLRMRAPPRSKKVLALSKSSSGRRVSIATLP